MRAELKGAAAALGSAVLFGLSAPLAKLLLADTRPLLGSKHAHLRFLIRFRAGAGLDLAP